MLGRDEVSLRSATHGRQSGMNIPVITKVLSLSSDIDFPRDRERVNAEDYIKRRAGRLKNSRRRLSSVFRRLDGILSDTVGERRGTGTGTKKGNATEVHDRVKMARRSVASGAHADD